MVIVKRLAFILFALTSAVFCSCGDEYPDYAYVNFYIDPESAEYYNLNYGGRGWEYFEGGARGVVVFRKSWDEFIAFERSCVAKDCHGRLEVDTTNDVLILCPKCGSKYLYYDGSPLEGSKANRLLYTYCSYFDGLYLWVNNCN